MSTSRTNSNRVLLLALQKEPWFDEMYAHFLAAVRQRFDLVEAADRSTAESNLTDLSLQPCAVLVIDSAITQKPFRSLRSPLSDYVKQRGGTVIFCGLFSSMTGMPAVDNTFADIFRLNWTHGPYFRTTFALNNRSELVTGLQSSARGMLPNTYSMKALHLSGVPASAAVYKATNESVVESLVFAPEPVDTTKMDAPVVFAQVENGYIGYIGDVNAEAPTTSVVVAMLDHAMSKFGQQ